MMEIGGISAGIISGLKEIDSKNTSVKDEFSQALNQMLNQVEEDQLHAETQTRKLITGSIESLHQVTFAMEQAKLSFQLAVQVRNKLV
ncbi:MAG: flagellar hook-basal body complex protein FliE, partial [Dehalobacterium sp.]